MDFDHILMIGFLPVMKQMAKVMEKIILENLMLMKVLDMNMQALCITSKTTLKQGHGALPFGMEL